MEKKKLKFERVDENGRKRTVTLRKQKIKHDFFSAWSKKMAYVLGVVVTDGTIQPNFMRPSKRNSLLPPPKR